MVNRLIFTLLAMLCWTSAAVAQTFPKPPDVPAFVQQTTAYASGTNSNVIGNGSTTGGAAPADSYELADIPAPLPRSTWATQGSYTLCETTLTGGTCFESKFRTRAAGTHILYDDPIRNYGQPGTSHCHTFFGNASANAYSTFATLRNKANAGKSRAQGGAFNGTAYWFPCMMKQVAGVWYIIPPNPAKDIIIYYTNAPSQSIKLHRLLLGLRYVGGYDMDAGNAYLQGLVNTANAQPGTAGRYRICKNSGTPLHNWDVAKDCSAHFNWRCVLNDGTGEAWAPYLKNADGSDPWGGKCTAGQDMWVQFQGPECWDGVNLWSPGGYKHVIPSIWDTVKSERVCPLGWFKIPSLALQIHFDHAGFSDYGTWQLSCDAGQGTLPGGCFHTDWMNGWDRTTLSAWLTQCIAIGHEGNTVPHECDGGVISTTEILKPEFAFPNLTQSSYKAPSVSQSTSKTIKVHDHTP